ncbi:MAG: ubiquinol-cytochrome c reductase iron-sulfur subunit [Magnetospirillum sp.]|nr:ubiquinol-cytochrome c reductase iron-sulfur subunit [Magnetospirillum sp.]
MPESAPQASKDASAEATRRDFLVYATVATAGLGAALACWPFIDFMNPSADVLATSTTDVDLAPMTVGQRITVRWRGRPVFVARRTPKEIQEAEDIKVADLRDPQTDAERVVTPEWLVVIGICTHLGCIPLGQKPTDPRGEWGGWFCPCHGSVYDTSARIRRGPAPLNLYVPHYQFVDVHTLRIGAKGGPKAASRSM